MPDSFRDRLKQKPLIGTFLTIASPEVAEILARSGIDWLLIDMEHGPFSVLDVQRMLQAIAGSCPAIVRVPSHEEIWIKKILDTGPSGLLIPHINTAREAQQVIQYCKYPPTGVRSVGIARAQGYGAEFQSYMQRSDTELFIMLQIEHIEGVRNIQEIVRVPGIDALYIGPYDLSGSMGKPGRISDKDVVEAIDRVRIAAKDSGLPLGIFGINPESIRPRIAEGYALLSCGMDILLFDQAVKEMVRSLRRERP